MTPHFIFLSITVAIAIAGAAAGLRAWYEYFKEFKKSGHGTH